MVRGASDFGSKVPRGVRESQTSMSVVGRDGSPVDRCVEDGRRTGAGKESVLWGNGGGIHGRDGLQEKGRTSLPPTVMSHGKGNSKPRVKTSWDSEVLTPVSLKEDSSRQ